MKTFTTEEKAVMNRIKMSIYARKIQRVFKVYWENKQAQIEMEREQ